MPTKAKKPTENMINELLKSLADKAFRKQLKEEPIKALKSIGWSTAVLEGIRDDIDKIEVNVSKMASITAVGTNCNCDK